MSHGWHAAAGEREPRIGQVHRTVPTVQGRTAAQGLEVDLAPGQGRRNVSEPGGSGRVLTVYFCTNLVGTLTRGRIHTKSGSIGRRAWFPPATGRGAGSAAFSSTATTATGRASSMRPGCPRSPASRRFCPAVRCRSRSSTTAWACRRWRNVLRDPARQRRRVRRAVRLQLRRRRAHSDRDARGQTPDLIGLTEDGFRARRYSTDGGLRVPDASAAEHVHDRVVPLVAGKLEEAARCHPPP